MVKRLAILLTLATAVGCGPRDKGPVPPSAESPLRAKTVPDFARPSLEGVKIDTKAMRGKLVVVKFFAEYCEPCKRTLPAAQKMHERYAGTVEFIGVSEDEQESAARRMVATYGLTFPVVLDRGNVLAGRFRVNEIPVTFVIDPEGIVKWVGGPSHTHEDLERAIASFASAPAAG
jgi:cytochrome c biogenesis protein CcmG/thiol:disulfide interchange protein DsbE